MLAARMTGHDPADAYRLDLMEGVREGPIDREIALSYVRNARFFEMATPEDLVREFPAVVDAIGHLGEPEGTALKKITGLLQRHGAAVSRVMRQELEGRGREALPPSTLPRLYAEDETARLRGLKAEVTPTVLAPAEIKVVLVFDKPNQTATIEDIIGIRKGATPPSSLDSCQETSGGKWSRAGPVRLSCHVGTKTNGRPGIRRRGQRSTAGKAVSVRADQEI